MIKYILGLIIVLAIVLVAVTIGANNDQVITFNYIVAESQFQLSTLVAILYGFGLILGLSLIIKIQKYVVSASS